MSDALRVAIVVSHPIQTFVHFYRVLAQVPSIRLRVLFASSIGTRPYYDKEMAVRIQWETDLISGYDHEFLPEAEGIHRVGFWKINNPSVSGRLVRFAPDAVMIHGYSHMTALRALRWCRGRGVPVLIWSDSELLHRRSAWRRAVKQVVLPPLFRRIDAFLTVGDNNEAYYRHYGVPEAKMFRTPFTIDEQSFSRVLSGRTRIRAAVREQFGIPQNAFLALFVGKLRAGKRVGDLIVAIRAILREPGAGRPVCLALAGDGAQRSELEALAADVRERCFFLGFVNLDQLPEVYAAADVLVHPSEREAYGLVASEASLVGLPLVMSDQVGSVGPTDRARPGENTIVFPCGDTAALARAIADLAGDPVLYERMSQASLRIAQELGVGRSVKGFLNAVRAVTGRQV